MSEPALEKNSQLVWRIPSYQPALLVLVLCGAAALNIYAHPPVVVRIPTLVLGVLCGALAIVALRLHLVATDEGISVRQLTGEKWTPWAELADLEVVPELRGAPTIRLNRIDGSYVDVPPSLLQPSKPTAKRLVMRNLDFVVRQLEERRKAARAAG